MKLSIRTEYALTSLIHLARSNAAVSLANLAEIYSAPIEILGETLSALEFSGYIKQVDGEFNLLKSANEISVIEIIRLLDGALAPLEPVSSKGYLDAPMDREEKLVKLFEQLQTQIVKRLGSTFISELA